MEALTISEYLVKPAQNWGGGKEGGNAGQNEIVLGVGRGEGERVMRMS